jgi:methionine-rich copper-binding protein CopC
MKAMVLAIIAAIAVLPAICLAHTHLLRSVPAEKANLESSPPAAMLVFAEPVTLTAIRIESATGEKTAVKPPTASPSAEATVPLPTLVPGRYTMSWRAISEDGHIMSGVIHFTIAAKAER